LFTESEERAGRTREGCGYGSGEGDGELILAGSVAGRGGLRRNHFLNRKQFHFPSCGSEFQSELFFNCLTDGHGIRREPFFFGLGQFAAQQANALLKVGIQPIEFRFRQFVLNRREINPQQNLGNQLLFPMSHSLKSIGRDRRTVIRSYYEQVDEAMQARAIHPLISRRKPLNSSR